jgi:hypothetical protein
MLLKINGTDTTETNVHREHHSQRVHGAGIGVESGEGKDKGLEIYSEKYKAAH